MLEYFIRMDPIPDELWLPPLNKFSALKAYSLALAHFILKAFLEINVF